MAFAWQYIRLRIKGRRKDSQILIKCNSQGHKRFLIRCHFSGAGGTALLSRFPLCPPLRCFLLLPSLPIFCVSLFIFPRRRHFLSSKLLIVSRLFVRRRPLMSTFSEFLLIFNSHQQSLACFLSFVNPLFF